MERIRYVGSYVRHLRVAPAPRMVGALALVAAGGLGSLATVPTGNVYAAGQKACAASISGSSASACRIMPSSGAFTLPIPGTSSILIGTGTPDRAGKPIVIRRTSPICASLGGFGLWIQTPRSTGLLPPLRWTTGTLYMKSPHSSSCSIVTSPAVAAAPGLYQVVAGSPSGLRGMPHTGGAISGASTPLGPTPWPVGFVVILLGAGVALRSAAHKRPHA